MNTFDDSTGVFHDEDSQTDFTIAMIDDGPGSEMFRITGCPAGNQDPCPETQCNEAELLGWLARFFGDSHEHRFQQIIERIKMDRRQDEGGSEVQRGSLM